MPSVAVTRAAARPILGASGEAHRRAICESEIPGREEGQTVKTRRGATETARANSWQAYLDQRPIVMALVSDPVESGLVASLKHPGGNVTGLSLMLTDLSAKRLQLLKETVPSVARVAVLWNPDNYSNKVIEELKAPPAPSATANLASHAKSPSEIGKPAPAKTSAISAHPVRAPKYTRD